MLRELGASEARLDHAEVVHRDGARALVALIGGPEVAGIERDREHPATELRVEELCSPFKLDLCGHAPPCPFRENQHGTSPRERDPALVDHLTQGCRAAIPVDKD